MNVSPTAAVRDTWRSYWSAHGAQLGAEAPAYLAKAVACAIHPRQGLRVLEAGSGTGGLAAVLAKMGADVTVLDIVPACARAARFQSGLRAVVADLFHAPFADGAFDVVFNSGVMEHFEPDTLECGLREMARVLRPGGRLVVVVPSARGRFYVAGKRQLEARGEWEYGTEHPQDSLAAAATRLGLTDGCERLVRVRWQARFLRGWRAAFARVLTRPFAEDSAIGAALFGGYLLVSAWTKRGGTS